MNQVLLEARPYRPFKSSEEYLYAMREDLAEWLNLLYPELSINVDNFLDRLDTGVTLCKHANNVRSAAEEYIVRRQARNKSMTRSMTTGLAGPILAMGSIQFLSMAKSGTFFARDNVSNFIAWCRKSLQIFECLLFETDDLIMRKNEKHVILCLLEVARRGAKFGMLAPMLVQMERQIDREIAADNKANGISIGCGTEIHTNLLNAIATGTDCNGIFETDSEEEDENNDPGMIYGPQPQIVTNDLKSLDEMVRDLVEKCTCPSQFPMVLVSEGKYRIGDTKVLIFVRILRSHVMVRVGGGWDTLSHYLDKHDPCRCRTQHRSSVAAKLITRTNNNTNGGIELHKAQVVYDRSPSSARKHSLGQTDATIPVNIHNNLSNNLLPPVRSKSRSRSPTPHRKQLNGDTDKDKNQQISSPNLVSRSVSPSLILIGDFKRKPNSIESNSSIISNNTIHTNTNGNINNQTQIENFNIIKEIKTDNILNGENLNLIKSDNISDNGSEISDEGYRSLGLIQTNKRTSVNSEASNEDAENNAHLEQVSNDDQSLKIDENGLSSPDTIDGNINAKVASKVTFEQSGPFITDDEISVNIATTTGLRKTGFSDNLYGNEPPKEEISKIPRSPMQIRRISIDNVYDMTPNGLNQTNRKMPVYRSVRKPILGDLLTNKKDGNSTWSGRSTKARPSITSNTFQQRTPSSSSTTTTAVSNNFNRNSATKASPQTSYDTNGRKIKSGGSSVNTSPVKKSPSSPLAKQIIEVAGTSKNDIQILEKMKELLNKYKYKPKSQTPLSTPEYDDFTTAWVNSNGALDRVTSIATTTSPQKDYSKRSSIVSSTDDSSNSNKDLPVVVSPRKNRRGCSKIPAPVRNAEIY